MLLIIQYAGISYETRIHNIQTSLIYLRCAQSLAITRNSRGAGWHAFARRFAGFRLFQRRALSSLTHRELEHLSFSSAIASGKVGVHTDLGAGAPLGPVGKLAVFGKDAGLDGQRQIPQCAQAAAEEGAEAS